MIPVEKTGTDAAAGSRRLIRGDQIVYNIRRGGRAVYAPPEAVAVLPVIVL